MNNIKQYLFTLISLLLNYTHEQEIIIIGAGPAGLATASRLLENGIDDILILEAEKRIGGRVNTYNFDGVNVDMGAEWCHGEKNNIVFEILQQKNLLYLIEKDVLPEKFFLSSRQNVSEDFSKELFNIILGIYYEEDETDSHETTGTVLTRRYLKHITEKYGNDKIKYQIANSALEFLEHGVLTLEGAFSWFDSSSTSDYEDAEGYLNWGWKTNGYRKFLDVLTKKYPNPTEKLPIDDKILLNREVTKIKINKDDVEVFCSDDSIYRTNHVVFTPSLGVLKAKAKTLFVPALSKQKIRSIENIGFGAVMKVFIKYDRKWWSNSPGFNFIWTEADRAASKKLFPNGPTKSNGESWIVDVFQAMAMPHSNVLLIWITGELEPIIEKMDERTLLNGLAFTLDRFLGHLYNIPPPQNIVRSTWYSNPHFRGTYSFATLNSSGDDVRNLLAPITKANGEPIVQFAGEATSPKHHSTVHGAVESGFREADRLIEIYTNKKSTFSHIFYLIATVLGYNFEY